MLICHTEDRLFFQCTKAWSAKEVVTRTILTNSRLHGIKAVFALRRSQLSFLFGKMSFLQKIFWRDYLAFQTNRTVFITFNLHHVWQSPDISYLYRTCDDQFNVQIFYFLAPQQTMFTTIPIIFFLCGFLAFFFCSIYIGANYLHDHLQVYIDYLVWVMPFMITCTSFQMISLTDLITVFIRMKSGGIR